MLFVLGAWILTDLPNIYLYCVYGTCTYSIGSNQLKIRDQGPLFHVERHYEHIWDIRYRGSGRRPCWL